jgi:hypothetical protein
LAKAEFTKQEYEELQYELIEAGIAPGAGINHHVVAQKIFQIIRVPLSTSLTKCKLNLMMTARKCFKKFIGAHMNSACYPEL